MDTYIDHGDDNRLKLEQRGITYYGRPNDKKNSKVPTIWTVGEGSQEGKECCSALIADGSRVCVSTILYSNGRCRKHGGATPSGMASPHHVHGRYSRSLPTRLAEKYEEALRDPEMHSLEHDIALIDARINDLLESSDEGGATDIFREITDAWNALSEAEADNDEFERDRAFRRMGKAVKEGRDEANIWLEIRSLQEQRRKLVLAEAKRLEMTNQMITVTKVNLLISALLDAVRQEVSSLQNGRAVLSRVSERFLRITNAADPKQLTK